MITDIRRTIIIGLGEQGRTIAEAVQERLMRRYGGVPIVHTIIIVEESGTEPTLSAPDGTSNSTILTIGIPTEETDWRRHPQVAPWLPDIPAVDLNFRAGARVALLAFEPQFRRKLREHLKAIIMPTVELSLRAKSLRPSPIDTKIIDVYVVGNLGDALASGLYLDLTYLVKQITAQEAADNVHFQLYGILLLPELLSDWQEADDDWQRWRQANAYATLVELDHYMKGRSYQMDYLNWDSRVVFDSPPLEPGFCYMIGDTNEQIDAITSHDAIHMTAEWLCHIITATIYSSVASNFQIKHYGPGQAIGAYSSFGLGSLILPLQFIQEYSAKKLTHDLAAALLTRLPDQERHEQMQRDAQRSPILRDSGEVLRRLKEGLPATADRDIGLNVGSYQARSRFEAFPLESWLSRDYNQRRGTVLRQFVHHLQENKNKAARSLGDEMRNYVTTLFDDDAPVALDRAISYYEALLTFLRGHRGRLASQIKQHENRETQYHRKIQEARGDYFNVADSFQLSQWWPSLLAVASFVVLFVWTYHLLARLLPLRPWAYGLIGMGTVLILLFLLHRRNVVDSVRARFIQRYDERLKNRRQLDEKQIELALVAQVEGWAVEHQGELVQFRERLTNLQQQAAERLQRPDRVQRPWESLLFGNPYFSLEESVIDQNDLDQYYTEVRGETSRDFDRHFIQLFSTPRYGGPYSAWLAAPPSVEALWVRLNSYAAEQACQLEKHYVVEKIQEKYTTEHIREDIQKMQRLAEPYLRSLMRADLGEEAAPQIAVAVHFENKENEPEGSRVAQALSALQLLGHVAEVGERERLTVVKVRRGIPLFVLPDVLKYESSYRQLRKPSLVHTTRGNIALPDIFQSQSQEVVEAERGLLDPRQAFCLALALHKVGPNPFDLIHHYSEPDAQAAYLPGGRAGYYHRYIESAERHRAILLGRDPRPMWVFLGPGKAEACQTLFRPELWADLRHQLTDYVDMVGMDQVAHLMDKYLYEAQRPDGDGTVGPLEDWEAQELQRAVDIMLHESGAAAAAPPLAP